MDEDAVSRIRARVLWYAMRTAILEGRKCASFTPADLARMLEANTGKELDRALASLPGDAIRVQRRGGKVLLMPHGQDDVVGRVLQAWRDATGRSNRTIATPKRKQCVRKALALGYTEDELLTAIATMGEDPFANGDNDRQTPFNDLQHAIGTEERIDRWLAKSKLRTKGSQADMSPLERARQSRNRRASSPNPTRRRRRD